MVDRLVNTEVNNRRIAGVEKAFGSSGQPLCVPGRVLVGEGVLTKMCRKGPKPRQFFLMNDILVYGNIVMNKKKYTMQHIIDLMDVKLKSLEDTDGLRNGWQIVSPKKSFAVYAATATEKSEWMAHINKCVQDLLAKGGHSQTSDVSPVWIPDSEAPKCMLCKKVAFTVLQRRHHCRKCGLVVCGMCSTKRQSLPMQSTKPLRVCDQCYDSASDESKMSAKSDVTQGDSSDSSSSEDEEETNNGAMTGNVADAEKDSEPTFYEDKKE
ncbi:pleckstrin homology domain-containing family F member 2-like isoform X1 [Lineus longissimus]|uniref:pleckstrin homology domain-containing family F member 2-like isoform X1 n=2 Tax=Lineus longissimus TaxID=88925 RepID=UPI002B4D13C9